MGSASESGRGIINRRRSQRKNSSPDRDFNQSEDLTLVISVADQPGKIFRENFYIFLASVENSRNL
jgi:hypothetical protein